MIFTREQKQTAYKKLSPETQSFIMDTETAELITNYLKETTLSEEQSNLADSEILYAMFGLQTLDNTINNIAKLSNKNVDDLSKLKIKLQDKIFSKIPSSPVIPNIQSKDKVVFGVEKKSPLTELGQKFSDTNREITKDKLARQDLVQKIKSGNKNNTPDYLKNLPLWAQELAFDKTWIQITGEVAKKYSLNNTQTDVLINNVLFVLIGLDTPDTFLKLMSSELGISKLLADQIVNDLENRVFSYALKFVETREKSNSKGDVAPIAPKEMEKKPAPAPIINNIPPKIIRPVTLEVKPENLPMVEKGEKAHDVKPFVSKNAPSYRPVSVVGSEKPTSFKNEVPKVTESKPEVPRPEGASHITYVQKDTNQPIQRPIPVPRFTATPIENTLAGKEEIAVEKIIKSPESIKISPKTSLAKDVQPTDSVNQFRSPQSIMDDKLKNVSTPPLQKEEPKKPVHNYTVDPYREPLQ